MPKSVVVILLCLLLGASPVAAAKKGKSVKPAKSEEIKPEDLKVVAAIEDLKLMDIVEDMDMLKDKDINYLIEDNQNENENKKD
jgi:hypothetical protein